MYKADSWETCWPLFKCDSPLNEDNGSTCIGEECTDFDKEFQCNDAIYTGGYDELNDMKAVTTIKGNN